MKVNKWFRGEILERFMGQEELEDFQIECENAKVRNTGWRAILKRSGFKAME